METIFERVGALDVHKAQVTACVRVPDAVGRREPHLADSYINQQQIAMEEAIRRVEKEQMSRPARREEVPPPAKTGITASRSAATEEARPLNEGVNSGEGRADLDQTEAEDGASPTAAPPGQIQNH